MQTIDIVQIVTELTGGEQYLETNVCESELQQASFGHSAAYNPNQSLMLVPHRLHNTQHALLLLKNLTVKFVT